MPGLHRDSLRSVSGRLLREPKVVDVSRFRVGEFGAELWGERNCLVTADKDPKLWELWYIPYNG